MKSLLRDFIWILPSSLGLGLVLSLLSGGTWWIGWLSYAFILILGLLTLSALWRSAGASRTLGLLLVLSVVLRLGLGLFFSYVLPVAGHQNNEVENAGYIFHDAFNRDMQAWQIGSSDESLWNVFDRSNSSDQYGGMLFLNTALYRFLSPDWQRSWLVILFAALTAAAGVGLVWKAAQQVWGTRAAALVAGIIALYPESILQGSSQMREPFLMTFIAMAFWGAVNWKSGWRAWAWLAGGLLGMLFFSPGVALISFLALGVWVWLRHGNLRLTWRGAAVVGVVLVLAVFLLWSGLARGSFAGASMVETFGKWLRYSAQYDTTMIQRASDGLQPLFDVLPESLHIPLVTVYGLAQPVLPAALVYPAPWPLQALGIFRALGWYVLLPFLIFGLIAAWKTPDKQERRVWLWAAVVVWGWILFSSLRAAGDQWDNPRYRCILLLWQAFLAAKAWLWWRESRNPWLVRILAMEGVLVVFFTYWYLDRYTNLPLMKLSFIHMLLIVAVIGGLIVAGGWLWDRRKK